MGLEDRDYMRRQGRSDSYHDRLFEPPENVRASRSERLFRTGGRRVWTWRRTMSLTFVVVFGLLVLPQFTIAGHHWRLFFL